MECPCNGCEGRSPTCHGKCEDYLEWSKDQRKMHEAERKKRNAERTEKRRYWSIDGYHY